MSSRPRILAQSDDRNVVSGTCLRFSDSRTAAMEPYQLGEMLA